MPIPFLIYGLGAAAAAVATAVAVKAFSDDDKPSGSGNSSDSDDAERRRQAEAEKERKKRERIAKREAAQVDLQNQGRAFGQSLIKAMPEELVAARLRRDVALDFDLKKGALRFNSEQTVQRDEQLLATVEILNGILTQRASHQKTIENLVIFSELYKPSFKCGIELQKKAGRMKRLDRSLEELKEIKRQLTKLENGSKSAQEYEGTAP